MSNFISSTNSSININPYLKSVPQIKIKKVFKPNKTQKNNFKHLQIQDVKYIFNNLDYTKLKERKKYDNFHIFSIREKRFESTKLKLNLRKKKNLLLPRKNEEIFNSQNSIFLTKNLSEGNFSELPKLLEILETRNDKKKKRQINNNRNKLIRKIDLKRNKSQTLKTSQVKLMFLDRIKKTMEKQNQTETRIDKVNSLILTKKINNLNIYRMTENFYLTYIDRFHSFLTEKKMHEIKKERLLEIEELTQNKLKLVKEQINSIHKSQRLLDNSFKIKYQEYLLSLYKDKESQKKKDIILTDKIYELRKDVLVLEKKVKKLLIEKNAYIKWMLLQIQVKNKLLNIPKEYQEYLKMQNTINLPQNLKKYMENIIFPSPQDLIKKIENYENQNIKYLEIYQKINNEIYTLKNEFYKEVKIFDRLSQENEINNLIEIKLKLKYKNQLLISQKNLIIKEKNENIFNKKSFKKKIFSKLYEKIKLMKNNIVGQEIEEEYENQGKEILKMLKKIEIEIDIQKKKHEFYYLNSKEKLKIAKEKIEKEKRLEKMEKNRKMMIDKQIEIRENIIKKTKEQFLFPKKKINWINFNIKKVNKKIDNEVTKNYFLRRYNHEYFIFE